MKTALLGGPDLHVPRKYRLDNIDVGTPQLTRRDIVKALSKELGYRQISVTKGGEVFGDGHNHKVTIPTHWDKLYPPVVEHIADQTELGVSDLVAIVKRTR